MMNGTSDTVEPALVEIEASSTSTTPLGIHVSDRTVNTEADRDLEQC